MELGELVNVSIPDVTGDPDCPFAHEKPKAEEKNELGGIGSKLGDNLAAGKGVHTTKPRAGGDFTKCEIVKDPRDRSPKVTAITIKVNGDTVALKGEALPYPLTCAAHHLIPAQEALKGNQILRFMCKEGEQQDFRNSGGAAPATVANSAVWGNVAYNVNGGQNGVWLPGNYAVGAGAGGVDIWKEKASDTRKSMSDTEAAEKWERALDLGPDEWKQFSEDPQEEEGPQPGQLATTLASAAYRDYMLAGKNFHIDPGNPKWGYVKAAMDKIDGTFHDRHEPYSNEVKKYLTKIAERYEAMYDRSTDPENPCKECEKADRPEGAKANLVGPPYAIVARLIAASNFFKGHVRGPKLSGRNIFTSRWVDAWMATKQK